jgi:uncharacterized membrane protein YphA (DoxX/SURF4 family)
LLLARRAQWSAPFALQLTPRVDIVLRNRIPESLDCGSHLHEVPMMDTFKFSNRTWGIFFARAILGLIFFMAGWWKVFTLGPLGHARSLFVEPYADTFLPSWSLWASGVVVPLVELAAGTLLLVGLKTRPALLALGGVLLLVTFGHLLADPLYQFHTHVIPRTALLLFLLTMPASADRISLDSFLATRQGSSQ